MVVMVMVILMVATLLCDLRHFCQHIRGLLDKCQREGNTPPCSARLVASNVVLEAHGLHRNTSLAAEGPEKGFGSAPELDLPLPPLRSFSATAVWTGIYHTGARE